MASPVDAGRATTNKTTATTDFTFNLPGSIAAGDILLVYVRTASSVSTSTPPTGWTATSIQDNTADASDDSTSVHWKLADGSESGTQAWTLGATAKGALICWRFTGASSSDAPEGSSATTTTGANINPASFTPTTPGGSHDYLWLSIIGMDSETGTASNGTLSNVSSANSGTGGAVATNCIIWGGTLASTASSIDIAAWTSSAPNSGASAFTIAIYPAAVAQVFGTESVYVLQAVNRASVY